MPATAREYQINVYGFAFVKGEDGLYRIMQGHESGEGNIIVLSLHDLTALFDIIQKVLPVNPSRSDIFR